MPKKHAQQSKNALPPIPNRDLFMRINFTLQASVFLQQLDAGHLETHLGAVDRKGKRRAVDQDNLSIVNTTCRREGRRLAEGSAGTPDFGRLARDGMKACRTMAQHNQLKLDPSLKRSICRACGTVLIPGLTCRIRNRPNRPHMHRTHQTCLACLSKRTLPAPPVHLPSDPAISADPTYGPSEALDGPMRKRRRERAMTRSKIAFHEREERKGTDAARSKERKDVAVSHGGRGAGGSLLRSSGAERNGMAEDGRGEPGRGHTLWKEGERVHGWGIMLS